MQIRLGEKIRTLRKQKGLSQDVLASALGVSFQAVSKWEKADSMPDVTLIPAIASFFGVSTDELFDLDIYKAEEEVIKICNRAIAELVNENWTQKTEKYTCRTINRADLPPPLTSLRESLGKACRRRRTHEQIERTASPSDRTV